jgi:hypothetical protein
VVGDEILPHYLQGANKTMAKQTINKKRSDFVSHGSDKHAAMIGIRKATDDDELKFKGWALTDMTAFGPQTTMTYLKEVLRQKVSVIEAGAPPVPQCEDRDEPNYAPPMFNPA